MAYSLWGRQRPEQRSFDLVVRAGSLNEAFAEARKVVNHPAATWWQIQIREGIAKRGRVVWDSGSERQP